jgi:signal transduction histidine kinase
MNLGPITRLGLRDDDAQVRHIRIMQGVFGVACRQIPQAVLVSLVGGIALVAVFWRVHDQRELISWYIALLCECLLRLRLAHDVVFVDQRHGFSLLGRRQLAPRQRLLRIKVGWLGCTLLSGVLWGIAGFHFYQPGQSLDPASLDQLVFIAVMLGVAFGSLTQYAAYPPSLYLFLPMTFLPMIGRMVLLNESSYYVGSSIVLAVIAFTLFFGRNFGRSVAGTIKGNLENEILVQQLLNERDKADEARRAAEAATRSKTQFFAAASHDLRQPLQAIGIYCSLLQKRAQGPLVPLVRNLSTGVETLSKLVEELLEISRLDSGAIQPRVVSSSLGDLFTVLEREFVPVAAAKRLQMRVRATDLWVSTDPVLFSRVIRNLVANAIRYTQAGGVLLSARRRAETVEVAIWDTGPGIGQHELNRIFEEFYRGESSKGDTGSGNQTGFGLGLSIVRRICGVLGHALTVRTQVGSGTVFRVSLPAARMRRIETQERTMDDPDQVQSIEGHRIVVLEDNEAILSSIARLLRSWGADVITATSFSGALVKQLGQDRRVDLIIADQNLGTGVDGAEAVFRIREIIGLPVPVILLTAVGTLDILAEFQHQMQLRLRQNPAAADAIARNRVEEPIVLTKPANPSVLNARILTALDIKPLPAAERIKALENVAEGREERIL